MKNAYVEITNVCNLDCSFCPGHDRAKRFMTADEFGQIAAKLNGKAENIFLHLMGEPLLHPQLGAILLEADKISANVKITTNGTLLAEKLPLLLGSKNLKTVCVSLHSFEANRAEKYCGAGENSVCDENGCTDNCARLSLFDRYLFSCMDSADRLADAGKYTVFRLWNLDGSSVERGKNTLNGFVLGRLREHFCREEWVTTHRGERIATHIFLEWGERFDWPGSEVTEKSGSYNDCESDLPQEASSSATLPLCHGLLTQMGILCDGTVVPCCLDRNGSIPLGNIFESSLDEILSSLRASRMREAMAHHVFVEGLCRACPAALGSWRT